MVEIWKDVVGYEGLYQVSDQGNVRSLNWKNQGFTHNLYLKHHPRGYRQVELYKDGTSRMLTVHRLVAQAFIPNPDGLTVVNHKDEDKSNNAVTNLEWCTSQRNFWHSWDMHHSSRPLKKPKTRSNSGYARHPEKVLQMDLAGNIIRVWDSAAAAAKERSYNNWSILQCCKGKRTTAYGFKWCFAI